MNKDTWDKLNEFDSPIEYDNDTELDLGTLLDMKWTEGRTEESNYSHMTATTYTEPSGRYAKKVYSDGFVEFYELADMVETVAPLHEIKRYTPGNTEGVYYLIYWESDREPASYSLAYINNSVSAAYQAFISEYLPDFLGDWPSDWQHIHYVEVTLTKAGLDILEKGTYKEKAAFLKNAERFDEFNELAFANGENLEPIQRLYCKQNGLDFDSGEAQDIWQECGLTNPKWMKAVKEYIKQNY